jgi:hypothetical protein
MARMRRIPTIASRERHETPYSPLPHSHLSAHHATVQFVNSLYETYVKHADDHKLHKE